jgi:hypothetical protein
VAMSMDAMQGYADVGVHRLLVNLGSQQSDRVSQRLAELEKLVRLAG